MIQKENNDEIVGEGLDLFSGHRVKEAYFVVLFSLGLCVLVDVGVSLFVFFLKQILSLQWSVIEVVACE